MLKYLKNAWYAAAHTTEVSADVPLARTLLDRRIVLFRDANGVVTALPDRCPHRFAPLSAGKIVNGAILCPYHGLRFDSAGHCILNPHAKNCGPLRAADIPAVPVMERYGIVWFWGGAPDTADLDLLPRIEFLERPEEYAVVHGRLHVRGHYELVTDNLLDLSHSAFIHPQFVGGRYTPEEVLAATKQKLERQERCITNHRLRTGLTASPPNVELLGMDPDVPVYTDLTMTWHPPAMLDFAAGTWEIGTPREAGSNLPALHVITPETEFTSHYFFLVGRNRRLNDPAVDAELLKMLERAFIEQDEPMIEMVQRNMDGISDITALNPVLLHTDAAPISARRMLASLIASEDAAAQ